MPSLSPLRVRQPTAQKQLLVSRICGVPSGSTRLGPGRSVAAGARRSGPSPAQHRTGDDQRAADREQDQRLTAGVVELTALDRRGRYG